MELGWVVTAVGWLKGLVSFAKKNSVARPVNITIGSNNQVTIYLTGDNSDSTIISAGEQQNLPTLVWAEPAPRQELQENNGDGNDTEEKSG